MPSPIPFLSKLFLGLPGLLLWIVGGIFTLLLGFTAFLRDTPWQFHELAQLGLAIAAAIIGYLMVAVDGILSGSSRYHIPGQHIPQLILMELGVQVSIILGVCSGIGTFGQLGEGNVATILACFIVFLLSLLGTSGLYERLENSVEKWESDYLRLQGTISAPEE